MLVEGATLLCSCCVESFEGSETLVPKKKDPRWAASLGPSVSLSTHGQLFVSLYSLWSEQSCLPDSIYSRESGSANDKDSLLDVFGWVIYIV